MTKKIFVLFAAALVIAAGASVAKAEKPVNGTSTETKKVQNLDEIRNKIAPRLNILGEKLEVSVRWLEEMAARVGSRITKFEGQGRDMTTAKANLAKAQASITTAKASVVSLKQTLLSAIASSTPKVAFKNSKTAIGETIKDIKEARSLLVETVRSLKPGQAKTSTSTATTTAN